MKKTLFLIVLAKVCMLTLPVGLSTICMLMWSVEATVSAGIPPHGAITIAFDDNYLSQYTLAWPLMKRRGIVGTFYIVSDYVGRTNKMGQKELLDLQINGCEIASHSKTHTSFLNLSEQQIHEECYASKTALEKLGLKITNFAYPYGERNSTTDHIVWQYYDSWRGWGIQQFPINGGKVLGYTTYSSNEFSDLKTWVNKVYEAKGYSVIYFHNIGKADQGPGCVSIREFARFLNYVMFKNVAILTVETALEIARPPDPVNPKALFTWTPQEPYTGQDVTFDASASYDSDGHIINYTWDFGDGVTTTLIYPVLIHNYAAPGTYDVTLTVTDNDDLTGSVMNYLTVRTLLGDINGDGIIDILDILIAAIALGSMPGDSSWNPAADLNNDDVVDMFDLILVAENLGESV